MKNKKKAVKLAPKDYVNTLIWFLGGFWVEIMLDGNFTYNLGADTCTHIFVNQHNISRFIQKLSK